MPDPQDNAPASAPDVMPPLPPPEPQVGSDSEGSNATRHTPDPAADRRGPAAGGERPARGPYTTGNW